MREIQSPASKVLETPVPLILSQRYFHFKNQTQTWMKVVCFRPLSGGITGRHEFWDSSHACGVPHELIMSDRCLDAVMLAQTPTVVFGNHGDDGEGS